MEETPFYHVKNVDIAFFVHLSATLKLWCILILDF